VAALGYHGHAGDGPGVAHLYGAPSYFVLGATHAVLFWVSVSFLTPLVLLIGLFNGRRRLLHDIVLDRGDQQLGPHPGSPTGGANVLRQQTA